MNTVYVVVGAFVVWTIVAVPALLLMIVLVDRHRHRKYRAADTGDVVVDPFTPAQTRQIERRYGGEQ